MTCMDIVVIFSHQYFMPYKSILPLNYSAKIINISKYVVIDLMESIKLSKGENYSFIICILI